MNAAEMKRAAGRALELGLTAVLTVPVVLVILAAAAAAVWLWASRMLPQPVYEPETFTQARWEELDDRGVLVDSLLEQYCLPDQEGRALLQQAYEQLGLTMRAYRKICKIARTIADLKQKEQTGQAEIAEALQFRIMEREEAEYGA